jgi:hypothetical protein
MLPHLETKTVSAAGAAHLLGLGKTKTLAAECNGRQSGVVSRRRRTVAIHEAGHAVAAILHDIAFKHVTIVPAVVKSNGRPGIARYRPCDGHVRLKPVPARYSAEETKDSPASLDFWHRRLIVNLAGPAAHKKLHPHAHWLGYAGPDMDEAIHVIRDIRQCAASSVVNAHYKYIEALATACIENYWKEIEAVTAALIKHNTLSSDQVREAMLDACRVLQPMEAAI